MSVEVLEEQRAGPALVERGGFQVEGTRRRQMPAHDGRPHTLLIPAYRLPDSYRTRALRALV